MRCPVCQLELASSARQVKSWLTYSFKDWAERCRYQRGDPILCAKTRMAGISLARAAAADQTAAFRSQPGRPIRLPPGDPEAA